MNNNDNICILDNIDNGFQNLNLNDHIYDNNNNNNNNNNNDDSNYNYYSNNNNNNRLKRELFNDDQTYGTVYYPKFKKRKIHFENNKEKNNQKKNKNNDIEMTIEDNTKKTNKH